MSERRGDFDPCFVNRVRINRVDGFLHIIELDSGDREIGQTEEIVVPFGGITGVGATVEKLVLIVLKFRKIR